MTGPADSTAVRIQPPRPWLTIAFFAIAVQVGLAFAANLSRFRDASTRLGDVDIYEKYADLIVLGRVPYRDFVVEYPPACLPLLLVPRLVSRDVSGYRVAFAMEMLAFHAGTVLVVCRWLSRSQTTRGLTLTMIWYSLATLPISRLVVSRYDAAPAFFSFSASCLLISGRGRLGGVASALGAMMKLFPALTVPFAPSDSHRLRAWTAFVAASAVGFGAWLLLGGWSGIASSLSYHAGRDLEFGSVYSGLQMIAAKAAGADIAVHRDHASFSTVTFASSVLKAAALPIQIMAIAAVIAAYHLRERVDPMRHTAAAIVAFACLGKVFSPQYAIWILPYVAAMGGPIACRARRTFLIAVASTLAAQGLIGPLDRTSLGVIVAYNVKNLAWLALLIYLVRGAIGRRATSAGLAGSW